MSTTQPTPGPWHIGLRTAHSKRDVYGQLGELVALADAVFTDLSTAQANARLIAAAPELLATLKDITKQARSCVQYANAYDGQLIQAIANATAAMALANGVRHD